MTTLDGFGEVSDHSRSMAITAGSTLSATAGPPAISNATSTIAKRRMTTSPDESPKRIYKAADSAQGATARREVLRGILWESVTYLPALPTRKRRQRIDDGSNSVFLPGRMRLLRLLSPRWARRRPQAGRLSPAMSAHLAFVDDAHFAQENGAFRPHLLPFCYRRLVNRTKRRFHDLRGLVVTARDQVPIDIQGDCGISVTKPARDGQNVHAARDQH